MKKKTFVVLLLLLISFSMAFSETTDPAIEHFILGYVRSTASLSISMFEEVFPFDLDGSEVSYNKYLNASSGSYVYGLRIGEYTLVSNAGSTCLYVSHSPLILDGSDGTDLNGKKRKIDYRLYFMTDAEIPGDSDVFKSCVSDANPSTPTTAVERIVLAGTVELVNKSIYVSLDEGDEASTNTQIANLAEGIYKSNIYFLLEGE